MEWANSSNFCKRASRPCRRSPNEFVQSASTAYCLALVAFLSSPSAPSISALTADSSSDVPRLCAHTAEIMRRTATPASHLLFPIKVAMVLLSPSPSSFPLSGPLSRYMRLTSVSSSAQCLNKPHYGKNRKPTWLQQRRGAQSTSLRVNE